MLTEEERRSQPHEVHARGVRPGAPPSSRGEDRNGDPAGPARTVHRLRRMRQVPVRAVTEIGQAHRHRAD
ncbi:hypothetical protein ABGB18_08930 [Nonomuraea sp. B12E4]|uniref:hypothetical protein n=1 Tax=Nonomuraea sp. B12E4 TaxID=3153564 RepID=UPI00325D6AA6